MLYIIASNNLMQHEGPFEFLFAYGSDPSLKMVG